MGEFHAMAFRMSWHVVLPSFYVDMRCRGNIFQ